MVKLWIAPRCIFRIGIAVSAATESICARDANAYMRRICLLQSNSCARGDSLGT